MLNFVQRRAWPNYKNPKELLITCKLKITICTACRAFYYFCFAKLCIFILNELGNLARFLDKDSESLNFREGMLFLKGCHVVNNDRRIMYHPSFDRKLNKL